MMTLCNMYWCIFCMIVYIVAMFTIITFTNLVDTMVFTWTTQNWMIIIVPMANYQLEVSKVLSV
jgi:hypothetical protein